MDIGRIARKLAMSVALAGAASCYAPIHRAADEKYFLGCDEQFQYIKNNTTDSRRKND